MGLTKDIDDPVSPAEGPSGPTLSVGTRSSWPHTHLSFVPDFVDGEKRLWATSNAERFRKTDVENGRGRNTRTRYAALVGNTFSI